MAKIKDISNECLQVIQLMNQDKLFKKIKVYKYEDCRIFYCITHYNSLHISASTPQGPASKEGLMCIFHKLTKKPIENFEFFKTTRASYFVERENDLLN